MKRILICLSVLVLLGFGAVPAQALIGVPDDVPGRDILVPFFYVSMPDPYFGDDNTLITITEVKGVATDLHYLVSSKDGRLMFDAFISLTGYDVAVIDALTIINEMSQDAKAALEIDVDGDGVNDHWAGYIYFFNQWPDKNNLISHVYQVDLPAGRAVSYNPPRLEHPSTVANPRQVYPDSLWNLAGDEAYSANALWIGKNLLEGNGVPGPDASFFRMIFRYNIFDKRSENLLIIWVETEYTKIPVPGIILCYFYDEEENIVTINIPINYGLNILDIDMYIPPVLFSDYPKAGWVDINMSLADFDADRSWIGYSWQRNNGKKPKGKHSKKVHGRWDVIQPADREAGYLLP